ncbi:hypothetical protein M0R45_006540 [Rubus argutus]|uniref:Protein kinase domain-containing protein n=1 Tax=Rubus argutus TaxID=59490 RepID=A0AAW1YQT8_RUBAR
MGFSRGTFITNSREPPNVHGFGLSCFFLHLDKEEALKPKMRDDDDDDDKTKINLEHNKAWLLAESAKELKWRRFESLERSISPMANTLIRFSYAEIRAATRNFSKGRILGRGALSCVFRGRVGILRTVVAIKRLDKEDKESSKAFCRELMISSSLHNPNVTPLLGFCIDPEEGLFLVYKYVSGGSLERHLHEKKRGVQGSSTLSWCIVHRDIKPSNILLSSKKTPKLCDFGLATWTSAPSILSFAKRSKEHLVTWLLTRRPQGEENLVLWAKPLLHKGKGAINELLDPRIKCTLTNSNQIAGEEEPMYSKRKKSSFLGNGLVIDCYSQLHQTNSEMKSHLALAMLGVSEFEDDDHLYGR